ncbi:MAG: carbohydrate kinase family protein [Candidatus Hodarchaeales archaeon]|jgi:sugar/nucleoside kinase (ribokinase family)
MPSVDTQFVVAVIGAVGIDTNVFLKTKSIDYSIEVNFTDNHDYVGQAGGYSSRLFAQLGFKTTFIGYIGEDFLGDYIKKQLTNDDIDIEGLFIDPKGTKRSINLVYPNCNRKNFYDAKGSMETKPDLEKCERILKKCKIAHFSIVNWARYLLPIAKRLGLIISVDLQDIVYFEDPYRKDFIDYADIVFFSNANLSDVDYMINRFLVRNSNQIVVVGMGDKGCAIGHQRSIEKFTSIRLDSPVIDTNGAGDSLAVGFLSSYYLNNYDLQKSIFRGQILARHVCSIKASTSQIIEKQQFEALVNETKNKRI